VHERLLIWRGIEEWRAEATTVELGSGALRATGTQIADEPLGYRLDYELETGERFVTRTLAITARGSGWRRSLRLGRAEGGAWTIDAEASGEAAMAPPGGDAAALAEALDCDLGFSPFTNLMPIRRHALHQGPGEREFTMAWVSVPELTVVAARQRYTHLGADEGGATVRFESLDGEFAGFRAELELDRDGLIRFYPELARRVG
jgi:hypothetical protein